MKRSGSYTHPFLLQPGRPCPEHIVIDTDPMVLYEIHKPEINVACWIPEYPTAALNYMASIGRVLPLPHAPWFTGFGLEGDYSARIHPEKGCDDPYLSVHKQASVLFESALPRGAGRRVMAQFLGTGATHFALASNSRRIHLTYRPQILNGQKYGPNDIHTDGLGLQMFVALSQNGIRIVSPGKRKLNLPPRCLRFYSGAVSHKHLTFDNLRGAFWEAPLGAFLFMKGHGWPNPAAHVAPTANVSPDITQARAVCFATAARGRFSGNKTYKPLRPFTS